jgi:hypothetical protein
VAARQCPNCLAMIPAQKITAYSEDLSCPGCKTSLEISGLSRNLASFVGLIAGAAVWWRASEYYARHVSALGWVLSIVFGYLALSIVAPLVLMLTADLRLKSVPAPGSLGEATTPPHPSH